MEPNSFMDYNPLLAITKSSGFSLLSSPQLSVKNLSDVQTPQACETKVIVPCEDIPISTLIVLWLS